MAVRQPIVGRDTFRVGQPDQPEVPVPLWQSADGEDTLGVGGQLVLGLQSRRDCRMPKTTTWTSWDLSTVPRLSHSYPPARATFTFRNKAAWGRSVGTLLARSLGAVTFSSLQAHPPRVPQFFVSIRNRGSSSWRHTPKSNGASQDGYIMRNRFPDGQCLLVGWRPHCSAKFRLEIRACFSSCPSHLMTAS